MTTTTTNEAAERYLASFIEALDKCFDPDPIHPTTYRALVRPHLIGNVKEALAAERRATVERIRERMRVMGGSWKHDAMQAEIDAILDEEAAR